MEKLRLEKQILEKGEHFRTGAEARIFRGKFLGKDVVIKERYPRTYRVKELDDALRRKRVRSEARLLVEARDYGVNTPRILDLDPEQCTIILQYLPYPSLKDELISIPTSDPGSPSSFHATTTHSTPSLSPNTPPLTSDKELVESEVSGGSEMAYLIRETGRLIGVLHANNIIHGDLTTSNILVNGKDIWFIDFGLAEKTDEVENKGVDLHVFVEAFESTHSAHMELLDDFYGGYREGNQDGGEDVILRAGEISKRGRYT